MRAKATYTNPYFNIMKEHIKPTTFKEKFRLMFRRSWVAIDDGYAIFYKEMDNKIYITRTEKLPKL